MTWNRLEVVALLRSLETAVAPQTKVELHFGTFEVPVVGAHATVQGV